MATINPHEFLELIRQLEQQGKLDTHITKAATRTARQHEGSVFDKLIRRAELIDSTAEIHTALTQARQTFTLIRLLIMGLYFIFGMLTVWALLNLSVLNFFYVYIALLGWHSFSLLWWLIRPKKSLWLHSLNHRLLQHFTQKQSLYAQALKILISNRQNVWHWRLAQQHHQALLAWLLGSLMALIGLFLFKEYQFVWQSTLLNQQHFATLVAIIAYIPDILGISVPNYTAIINNTAIASDFARLILSSLVLYALLPRFLCWLACYRLGQHTFKIDSNLYYYENLLRQLTVYERSPDDYQPAAAKPIQAVIPVGNKVVAMFETPAQDKFWYQFGAGHLIDDLGVLDSKDDIQRLASYLKVKPSFLYLGIDTAIVPDRGAARKLHYIATLANSGIAVELLGEHEHKLAWQALLMEYQIAEARFS